MEIYYFVNYSCLIYNFKSSTGIDVTKISSCRVNTTSGPGIKKLGISFGCMFLPFSYERSWRPHLQQPEKNPGPHLFMTALQEDIIQYYCQKSMIITSDKRIPYLLVTIHVHSTYSYIASFIWTSSKNEQNANRKQSDHSCLDIFHHS